MYSRIAEHDLDLGKTTFDGRGGVNAACFPFFIIRSLRLPGKLSLAFTSPSQRVRPRLCGPRLEAL